MQKQHTLRVIAFVIITTMLFIFTAALAEETWDTQPVITEAYEQETGKIYLEWSGKAPLYQLYLDGKQIQAVTVPSAIIDVGRGNHLIKVVPVHKIDSSDFSFGVDGLSKLGLGVNVAFKSTEIETGSPSEAISIDYLPDSILSANPIEPIITMNKKNQVVLSFLDPYNADVYEVSIRSQSDTRYVRYLRADANAKEIITIKDDKAVLYLTAEYLNENGCFALDIGKSYTFTVHMRKNAVSLLSGERIPDVFLTSKESKQQTFTPVEAWTLAPVITSASQTADGQVTLCWSHDVESTDGCNYNVMRINKALGIKISDELVADVQTTKLVINDLLDGEYFYTIVPRKGDIMGSASAEASVMVKNNWIASPKISLTQISGNEIGIDWSATSGVESYHINVFVGDNKSLLQFINMDYQLYQEIDIPAVSDKLHASFVYPDNVDPEKGLKLKFEIWGIRYTADGVEQKTSTTTETFTLLP